MCCEVLREGMHLAYNRPNEWKQRTCRKRCHTPSSRMGGTRSCRTGPSGRYVRTGTLRTLYAPSRSGAAVDPGSADGGRVCIDVEDEGGGDPGRVGAVVGVTFDATRQYSSKLSGDRQSG